MRALAIVIMSIFGAAFLVLFIYLVLSSSKLEDYEREDLDEQ